MDVTWLGHGCFRLRGRNAAVVTDPYPPSIGLKLQRLDADLVTISHEHENHSYVQAVREAYEISACLVGSEMCIRDRCTTSPPQCIASITRAMRRASIASWWPTRI